MMNDLLASFDSVRIINLPERTDRRREMMRELERIGATGNPRIGFFAATKPDDAGPFPSRGARGCFMSHLAVLREAVAEGVGTLLILEDDLDFSTDVPNAVKSQLRPLAGGDWDMFYGTYRLYDPHVPPPPGAILPPEAAVETASFVAFDRAVMPRIVRFLEEMLQRPAGTPDYGPMHVDGAYSIFRLLNPDVATYVAPVQLGYQRSSRSDISDTQPFFDKIPGLRSIANVARTLRRRMK
jgi:glycosyl transferase family 25